MAQVFVNHSDLAVEDASHPVPVIASYSNATVVAADLHGSQCSVMSIADNLIYKDRTTTRTFLPVLTSNWRDDYTPVLNAEAARRINLVFPDFKQRNYTAHYQDNITQYGADATSWPQQELDFKAEYDRGWQYVTDIRTASNNWTAMPTDPTADAIWPPTITPIQ